MSIQWIVAPLVGCVIGYITNWVAIKMLFRPHRAVFVFGRQLPFTPGLIPKEKERLATAVGDVVSRELLDAATVKSALLSDEMLEKISSGIDAMIEAHRDDERTLAQLVQSFVGEAAYEQGAVSIKATITDVLSAKLLDARLGDVAGKAIVDHVKKKSPSALAGLVSGLLDERIKHNITSQLGDGVNNYVRDNAPQLVRDTIESESGKLMDMKLSELYRDHQDKLPALKEKLLGGYRGLIGAGTERVLQTVDLSQIVQGRIRALDDRELESLIFSVVDRELNAIVWLGAMLGFLMGFVNLLFV